MEEKILNYLHENNGATFAELCDRVDGFAGESMMTVPDFANIIVWESVSQGAITALVNMQRNGKIKYERCMPVHYGRLLSYPIVTRMTSYKVPHWLPVLIYAI